MLIVIFSENEFQVLRIGNENLRIGNAASAAVILQSARTGVQRRVRCSANIFAFFQLNFQPISVTVSLNCV